MRIIGGELKGKTINPPARYQARPTTDFAKEGLFNILENEYDFSAISFLDLFAGTGSISLEAASRGCTDIVSVEMNPLHARFIRQCALEFRVQGMQVVRHNVFDFLPICREKFDLIFADPPYALEGLENIPDKVLSRDLLHPGCYFILEHGGEHDFKGHPYYKKEKTYGRVHFTFFEK